MEAALGVIGAALLAATFTFLFTVLCVLTWEDLLKGAWARFKKWRNTRKHGQPNVHYQKGFGGRLTAGALTHHHVVAYFLRPYIFYDEIVKVEGPLTLRCEDKSFRCVTILTLSQDEWDAVVMQICDHRNVQNIEVVGLVKHCSDDLKKELLHHVRRYVDIIIQKHLTLA